MNTFDSLYTARYEAASHQADTALVLFKSQARGAFRAFTKTDRCQAKYLTTASSSTYEFYKEWHDIILPTLNTIAKVPANTALKKSLQKSLLLEDFQVNELARKLAKDRDKLLKKQFVHAHYPVGECAARQVAYRFMNYSDEDNLDTLYRYLDFLAYKQVTSERNITVYDRWSPYFKRLVQHLWDNSQTKKLIRHTQRKIAMIREQIKAIETNDYSLVASVLSLNIDLVVIGAARQDYEKALTKLNDSLQKSPTKRLELYKEISSSLCATYLEDIAESKSLQDIQKMSQEIDTVLLRVFDLPTRRYNELMNHMKNYRDRTHPPFYRIPVQHKGEEMTRTVPKKLRVVVTKNENSRATYLFTLNREVYLSEETKYALGKLANGGRSKCFISVMSRNKSVIEVSINRGNTGDPVMAFEKISRIILELASGLQVKAQHVTIVYLAGRMDAITLSDLISLIEGVKDNSSRRRDPRARRGMFHDTTSTRPVRAHSVLSRH